MALIGTIRKNSWILILMIGLGLGGFIIMDMTSSGNGMGQGGGQFTLGKVEGTEIDYREFQNTQNVLYSGGGASVFDQRDYLWDFFVEKALVEKEAEKLGLSVGKDELNELQFGNNLSPIIQQRFVNPNTGQIDRTQLNQFRQAIQTNQLTPELRQLWYYQEKEIIKEQLQNKLNNIVSKGIYTPSWMAEMAHKDRNNKVSFEYVQIPFDEVADTEVEVTDADLNTYIKENPALYERDQETRRIDYVTFNVYPTSQDSADLLADLTTLSTGFAEAENDSIYIETNYGIMDPVFVTPAQIAPQIADQVTTQMEVGDVYGPYIDNDSYKLVKLIAAKPIADSVRTRHILRRAQTQPQYIAALAAIDSAKALLESGVIEFDSLAKSMSQDVVSAQQGGDIGFSGRDGRLAKQYNDLVFYQAEPGQLNTVVTQFGVHLVEVTDRKFESQDLNYKLAYIPSLIIPSQETQDAEYDKAADIVSENRDVESLRSAISAIPGATIEQSAYVENNSAYLLETGTSQTSREIIRWSYESDTEVGDVSPEVYVYEDPVKYYNSKYLIVSLGDVLPEGMATVASVRDEITPIVLNQKKGALLAGKISGTDLAGIASQYNSQIDSADNITFSSTFVPGLGNEPKVIASAFDLNIGDVSKPIVGQNGVYVIRITDKLDDVTDPNIALMRNLAASPVKSNVPTQLMESIKKSVNIRDNRYTFF